jgi:hypothetical protein
MRQIRWKCAQHGCFNQLKRLKFHLIQPWPLTGWTDIDGYCELGGYHIFLEWKDGQQPLERGQRLAFERLTKADGVSFVRLAGDAENMRPTALQVCKSGEWFPWEATNIEQFNARLTAWGRRALANPRLSA